MAKIRPQQGLCVTCKHEPTCTYRRDSGQPILGCDEYEAYAGTPRRATGRNFAPPARSPVLSATEEKYAGKYLGLCKSCENRGTCTFPKPEGGVWHCEEYR